MSSAASSRKKTLLANTDGHAANGVNVIHCSASSRYRYRVRVIKQRPVDRGETAMSIKPRKSRAQPVEQLLSSRRGGIGSLMTTARLIDQAQSRLDQILPDEMKGHVMVGGHHNGRLTLLTDRAVWLTWLRFERARLKQVINLLPGLEDILHLDFKVRPLRRARAPLQQKRLLSEHAAEHLAACAQDIDDPALQKALKRLASHAMPSEPSQD